MKRFCGRVNDNRGAGRLKRALAAVAAGALLMSMSAPVLAETYRVEGRSMWLLRDDHGKLVWALSNDNGGDHEASGWGEASVHKLWPDTTYYLPFEVDSEAEGADMLSAVRLLADGRYFSFSYKAEGSGKRIVQSAAMSEKIPPDAETLFGDAGIGRLGMLKLVTGHDTTDDEFVFRLTGKCKVKQNASLSALQGLAELLGIDDLKPGDVIELDFGRFVAGNRKTSSNDPERDAGEYAMVWDPAEADRNTLLFETEDGPLLELHMKGSTDTGVVYIKLNTSWKPFEDAGFIPELAFPGGDAALYSFESTNNLLDDTSRADLYIHNHPDTALGGESMTDLFEAGRLYVYSAAFGEDGSVTLTDIGDSVSVGLADGEKALRIKGRALNNIIISTVPLADARPQARAGEAVRRSGEAAEQPVNSAAQIGKLLAGAMAP